MDAIVNRVVGGLAVLLVVAIVARELAGVALELEPFRRRLVFMRRYRDELLAEEGLAA